MANKNTTKKALLMSVISLILCFSMLIGTTFAWFTDEVTSGKNQIIAGNLDVELEYSKDMKNWTSVEGKSDLIDPNALWEPGHTEVVYLKISNLGTLALKYSFNMSFVDTVVGKSVLGNDIYLSKYLKYAVVDVTEKFADRDAARDAVADEAVDLAAYGVNGEMKAGDSAKTVALVIYMPETVENEANYRGEDIPQIDLGVKLVATQLEAESDSFDNTYDANAEYVQYVYNEEQLREALRYGGIIKLGTDITLVDTVVAPAGVTSVLDLNGYALSCEEVTTTYALNNQGNLTLKDSVGTGSVSARGIYNGYSADGNNVKTAKLIVESGTYNAMGTDGGAAIFNYGVAEVNGGTFTSNGGYGLNNRGTMIVNDAEVKGGIYNMGDLTVNGGEIYQHLSGKHAVYNWAASLVINGGSFDSESGNELILTDGQDAKVEINGGTFDKTGKSWLFGAASGKNITFTINGGIFNGYVNLPDNTVDTIRPYGDPITVAGGIYNFDPTKWVAAGYKAADNGNGTWIVLPGDNTTWENNGYYYDGDTYYVKNANGLKTSAANAEDGDTVVLVSDVDYGTTQLVIDTAIVLDLNDNEITTANGYGGITLKNGVSIKNGTINHVGNTAAIKAFQVESIENVTINVTPTDNKVKGGIVVQRGADTYIGSIKNVTITGATNGIETYNCGWYYREKLAIGSMENVTIDATQTGMLLSAPVGTATNCEIKGAEIGINMHLKGEFDVSIELVNCTVTGTAAGIWAHDEVGISNTTNCSLTLTYDEATVINGGLVWEFEDECKSVVTLNAPNN